MNKATILPLFLAFSLLTFFACQNPKSKKSDKKQDPQKEEKLIKPLNGKFCFDKVYPYKDDPSKEDRIELRLFINNKNVKGSYNWLPAEKDQRKGTISGTLKENTIATNYFFMQEGVRDSAKIEIVLTENTAQISSEKKSLGLDVILNRVECQD